MELKVDVWHTQEKWMEMEENLLYIYTLFLIQDSARVIGEVELGNVEPHRLLYICIA
jgi:hypothetical protein